MKLALRLSAALLGVGLVPGLAMTDAPAKQAQATRLQLEQHLRQIGLAVLNYEANHQKYPPAALVSKDGKALLSWRVLILPYLEQGNLYRQFKQDEAWDSPHNLALLERMPPVFGPSGDKKEDEFKTFFRVFTGRGTVFENEKGNRLADVRDGTSNTILAVEAGEPVPWTKPEELPFDEKKELPRLGQGKEGFAVVLCDGSIVQIRPDFDVQAMRYAILRSDGNLVPWEKLRK